MAPKNKKPDTFVSTAPEPEPEVSAPEPEPEQPAEAKLDLQAAQPAIPVSGPDYVPGVGSVPKGMGTTYSPANPPAASPEQYTIPEEGIPGEYMILRVSNHGWVIEEKWQYQTSIAALQGILDAEMAAGHSGTLYRNNAVVFSWGAHAPPRR